MKEEYLHYIFDKRLLGKDFISTDKKVLNIIEFGTLNVNAGPDFLNAKLEYDNQIWVGAIEFHVKASDWYRHKHQNDPAYSTVIAHFVFEADEIVLVGEFALPTIELFSLVDLEHYQHYLKLINNRDELLCSSNIHEVMSDVWESQKKKSLNDRLRDKANLILKDINRTKGDFFYAYMKLLARCFGGQVNQLPFEELAQKIKRGWFAKLNYNPLKIEALCLGLAGFLNENIEEDPYITALQVEYRFQKNLFDISDHTIVGWKYARMRPTNFPDRRIAQFAKIANQLAFSGSFHDLFSRQNLFKSELIHLSDYWAQHYRIGHKATKKCSKLISKGFYDLLIINVEVPFGYAMGCLQDNENQQSKAIDKLKLIPAEKNRITKSWIAAGVKLLSAYDSQAFLALKKQSCIRKKCLFCAVGKSILNK